MNTLRQREIFKLGFQIQICQSKEKKMQILLQLTQDPFPINIRYIYDQFAHGVQLNKKKTKNKIPSSTNNSHSQSKNRRLG